MLERTRETADIPMSNCIISYPKKWCYNKAIMKKSPWAITLSVVDLLLFTLSAYPATDIIIRTTSGRLPIQIWFPFPIVTLWFLISGILALIRGSWRWAVSGLIIGVAAGVYFVYVLFQAAMGN